MGMNRKFGLLWSAVVCIVFSVSGCISVSYTPAKGGKSFAALGKDDRSEVYYEESRIPGDAAKRVFVGSAEASGSTSSCTQADIKDKLVKAARKVGANAVLITEIQHVKSGSVRGDQLKNIAAPSWTPIDDSASNVTAQRNMDLYQGESSTQVPVYDIHVKARFYRIDAGLLVREPLLLRSSGKSERRKKVANDRTTILVR